MRTNLRILFVATMALLGLCASAQMRGDVTGDGTVDVSDVNTVVNIILGKANAADFPGNADCNGDGIVDVADVNIIVNIILGKDVPPITTSTTFTRVTSTDQLLAGKRYLIVCETASGAMGGIVQNYYRALETEGIALDNGIATVEDDSPVSTFTLGGTSGSWTFFDGSFYLASVSAYYSNLNSVETATANSAKWTIDFSGNNAIITNKEYTTKTIYYLERYSDFNASASGTAVQLYVEETGGTPTITVATPTFSPEEGTYNTAQTVTITTATNGASIYYTTDGSTPTSSSTLYTGSITITTTTTLRAIAIKDGASSAVATATFTITVAPTDNNSNRNGLDASYDASKKMWGLEWPHISNNPSNTTWVVKSTSDYGVTLSLEWCNDSLANRWTCYTLHSGNFQSNVERYKGEFITETEIPSAYRTTHASFTNSGYARGHLCPSADRLCSEEQNKQTFSTANIHPQWQNHNSGQWESLEEDVRAWANSSACDTLYIVKAATINPITLNGTIESGVYSTTYNGATYADLKCNGKDGKSLYVPKYFYMALLAYDKANNQYYAMGIWTKHYNNGTSGADNATHSWPVITKEDAEYITIDELEARTGIDFFCNLPDNIEAEVEATLQTSFWSNVATLDR